MVNANTPCDHSRIVKRIAALAALAFVLAGCSGESGREFARYYDPEGYFVTTSRPPTSSPSRRRRSGRTGSRPS
jgi:hypothetical protein